MRRGLLAGSVLVAALLLQPHVAFATDCQEVIDCLGNDVRGSIAALSGVTLLIAFMTAPDIFGAAAIARAVTRVLGGVDQPADQASWTDRALGVLPARAGVRWMGPPDTHLASGAEVEFGQTFTRIGGDERSVRVAENAPPEPGMHDVVVHGDGNDFLVDSLPTNPHQIAEATRMNPSYTEGQPIRLLSCYSANGPAQELADALGVEVRAPTLLIGTPRYPPYSVVLEQGGTWQTFVPHPTP